MSGISTHVLDTATGRPAAGIAVHLWRDGIRLASAVTDGDGRCPALLPADTSLAVGPYRLVFEAAGYFPDGFYPEICIAFRVDNSASHYHVPLLLSPFGFTTYRGT